MKNNVITVKMLDGIEICSQGKRWFKRNYPDGLKITKKNVAEAVTKLHRLKNQFSLYGGSHTVVKSLQKMKRSKDYDAFDTPELLKEKQREDRFDNTANTATYGLDALWNAVGVEEGAMGYETMDLWYTREDLGAKGDLSAIINSIWSDIQMYRDYLVQHNIQ